MINNTNDDGKDLIRKLSSSIIFDARQAEIQLKYTLNKQPPVVDNVAYRYRGTCMSHMIEVAVPGTAAPVLLRNALHWPQASSG